MAAAAMAAAEVVGAAAVVEACLRSAASDYRQDPLWIRIAGFRLDDADAAFAFSQRLARENGWSRYYACRVVEEYKRFCYLAMVAGHPVTPSDQFDQAWHLHLLYTRNYWENFCGQVLRHPFHHGPTRGGTEERGKFREWYQATIDSYVRVFASPPPEDIWPAVDARFAAIDFRRIDMASCWIVPKPRLGFRRRR